MIRTIIVKRTSVCLSALLINISLTSHVAAASFTPLGVLLEGETFSASWANAISADGTTVVGSSFSELGIEAFRWTRGGGMVGLGSLPGSAVSLDEARAVSADGSVVVGGADIGGSAPFLWTSAGGMVEFGDPTQSRGGTAHGVSANGSVVVGVAGFASGYQAFRWTTEGDKVGLGYLPGGTSSTAYAVSADGSVVVGYGDSEESGNLWEAFRWTSDGGMVGLGHLPGGSFYSEARGVSADGSVVVGWSWSGLGQEAYRWTSDGGMVGLGDLPGGGFSSQARGVSADGSVIVGTSDSSSLGDYAFLWTEAQGMVGLKSYLVSKGVTNLTGWMLNEATGVSADGRTIVGNGINPNGVPEAWIATVPEPSTSVLALAGGLALIACRKRLQRRTT